jgi:uncharacterized membrane protein (UPF0127 family)
MKAHNNIGTVPIIGGALIMIVATFFVSISPSFSKPTISLQLGDGVFNAKVVSTAGDRAKGLAGVTVFNADQALLMVFPTQDEWSIGARDMKVDIDIVWLNSDKKVIYAVTDVTPELLDSEVYTPKLPAMYVVLLPAGTVKAKMINTISIANFNIGTIVGGR